MTDYYEVTTPATEEPLTLADVKSWLRIRITADDALLTALIPSVTLFGEKYCNRVFVQRTFDGFFDGLCVSRLEPTQFITIRRAPLLSVSSVQIMSGGTYTSFTDFLERKTNGGYARLLFPNGIIDASPDSDVAYPIKVSFVAGYGTASAVPEDIKTALKAHVAFLYENRGDVEADGQIGMPRETKTIFKAKYQILNV